MTNGHICCSKCCVALLCSSCTCAPTLQQGADEIEKRGTEIDVLRADAVRYEAEIAQLKGDLKAMTSFADLWYFVMYEKPLEFEKIVTEWSPAQWLHQAHLLKERTKK